MHSTTTLRKRVVVESSADMMSIKGMHHLLGFVGWKRRWSTSSTPDGGCVDASSRSSLRAMAIAMAQLSRHVRGHTDPFFTWSRRDPYVLGVIGVVDGSEELTAVEVMEIALSSSMGVCITGSSITQARN